MRSTMSILGLYNWNNRLFYDMVLPAGVNKQTLVDTLVVELAELEILYTDPNFLQQAIKAWSKRELPTWERVAKAAAAEYDPIENYDRMEEWTDSSASNAVSTVVGYNDPSQTPSGGANSSATGKHSGRTHGNIGVTTSQQMLEQELEIAPKLNVYNYIIESFRRRFCLLVY